MTKKNSTGLAKTITLIATCITVVSFTVAILAKTWRVAEETTQLRNDVRDKASKMDMKEVSINLQACWDFATRIYEEGTLKCKQHIPQNEVEMAVIQGNIKAIDDKVCELKINVRDLDKKLEERQAELLREIRELKENPR